MWAWISSTGSPDRTWDAGFIPLIRHFPLNLSISPVTSSPSKRGPYQGYESSVPCPGFFLRNSEFLTDKGYLHYEISNFARKPEYICRHNRKYWHHVPYLGLGPSAHSFQGGRRWWNVRSVREYCRALKTGAAPVEEKEILSPAQADLESVALGLRTQAGFDRSEIHRPIADKVLEKLEADGFLHCEGTRVIPTRKGFLFADHLPLDLCEDGRM